MTPSQRIMFSEILIANLEFCSEEDLFKKWRLAKEIKIKMKRLKRSMGTQAFEALMQKGKRAFKQSPRSEEIREIFS